MTEWAEADTPPHVGYQDGEARLEEYKEASVAEVRSVEEPWLCIHCQKEQTPIICDMEDEKVRLVIRGVHVIYCPECWSGLLKEQDLVIEQWRGFPYA